MSLKSFPLWQLQSEGIVTCLSTGDSIVCAGISCRDESIIKIWNISEICGTRYEEIPSLGLNGHKYEISSIQIIESAKEYEFLICSASKDSVICWTITDGRNISSHVLLRNLGCGINCIAFDSTSSLVALAQEAEVNVLETLSGELYVKLEGHQSKVTTCKFHPYELHIFITASEDRTFKIWDLSNHTLLFQSNTLSRSSILSMDICPVDGMLVFGFSDGTCSMFETEKFREIGRVNVLSFLRDNLKKLNEKSIVQKLGKPNVISSLPMWAKSKKAKESEAIKLLKSGNRGYESYLPKENLLIESEVALPILNVSFFCPYGERTSDANQHEHKESVNISKSGFYKPCTSNKDVCISMKWILATTPNHLIGISILSQEVYIIQDLQSCLGFRGTGDVQCIISSTFEPLITCIRVSTSLSPLTSHHHIEDSKSDMLRHEDNSYHLSVFPNCSPRKDSPLLRSFERPEITLSLSRSNKPTIDYSRIRSSGYGKDRPWRKAHRKSNNVRKTLSSTRSRTRISQEYPIGCSMLDKYQSKNSLQTGHRKRDAPIYHIEYSSDGSHLGIALNNHIVEALRLPVFKHQGNGVTFMGHSSAVNCMHWSHQNDLVVSSSVNDPVVRIWSLHQEDEPLLSLEAFSSNRGRRTNHLKEPKTCKGVVIDSRFYYLDKFILVAADNGVGVYLHDIGNSQLSIERKGASQCLSNRAGRNKYSYNLVSRYRFGETQKLTSIDCHNGFMSHLVLCSGTNKSIYFLDMSVEKTVRKIENSHSRAPHTVCFPSCSAYASVPPGSFELFLSASTDSSIHLWDVRMESGIILKLGEHQNRVHSTGVSFSPCMRYVAAGSEDKLTYIYDIRMGRSIERLSGHSDVVSSVSYNPVYPQLATASYDGRIRFYADKYD